MTISIILTLTTISNSVNNFALVARFRRPRTGHTDNILDSIERYRLSVLATPAQGHEQRVLYLPSIEAPITELLHLFVRQLVRLLR